MSLSSSFFDLLYCVSARDCWPPHTAVVTGWQMTPSTSGCRLHTEKNPKHSGYERAASVHLSPKPKEITAALIGRTKKSNRKYVFLFNNVHTLCGECAVGGLVPL